MPAAFLVLILLAALAVDSAVVFQARQQLHDALIGAANDAVTAGLDQRSFYSSGVVRLDPAQVGATVCQDLDRENLEGFHGLALGLSVAETAVRITASGSVDAVFGRAIPGFGTRFVRSSADADVQDAAGGQAPASFPPASPLHC